MKKKKILVINSISLFPKVMASQDRIINMVKRLSKDHVVDVITSVRNERELTESKEKLKKICNQFFPIPAVNPTNSFLKRKVYGIGFLLFKILFKYPSDYFYNSRKYYLRKFSEIINRNQYDIIQAEYWYMGVIFKKFRGKELKAIDTHDILFEKREQELRSRLGDNFPPYKKKYLTKYRELEISTLKLADLIINITKSDRDKLSKLVTTGKKIIISTGQNIHFFKNYRLNIDDKLILFYGSMSSRANIDAFFCFWQDILPLIKKEVPDVKVMVVGANPPHTIKKLHDGINMIVTGFVNDVRPHLAKTNVMVLPLNVAAGFRSRIVDVMAMGIPVIGTHKALDAVKMRSGIHGFVTDSKRGMADYAIKLIKDLKLREKMGRECRKFVAERYSIEATYGKLSKYFLEM